MRDGVGGFFEDRRAVIQDRAADSSVVAARLLGMTKFRLAELPNLTTAILSGWSWGARNTRRNGRSRAA